MTGRRLLRDSHLDGEGKQQGRRQHDRTAGVGLRQGHGIPNGYNTVGQQRTGAGWLVARDSDVVDTLQHTFCDAGFGPRTGGTAADPGTWLVTHFD